jgi:hypothetical protein
MRKKERWILGISDEVSVYSRRNIQEGWEEEEV